MSLLDDLQITDDHARIALNNLPDVIDTKNDLLKAMRLALSVRARADELERRADELADRCLQASGLKVYGWTSSRSDCPTNPNGNSSHQVHYVVAAKSWAAAHRAIPASQHESLSNMKRMGSVTGNTREVTLATRNPGVAYWLPLWQAHHAENQEWRVA